MSPAPPTPAVSADPPGAASACPRRLPAVKAGGWWAACPAEPPTPARSPPGRGRLGAESGGRGGR